ncbi:hypothetical protein [Levilactobacillus bambusae]|uniref:Uncharacterized protein n=1 Tax=Levilactobacillus bambusae TaxID=2024736 RepID=A0A2V1N0E5_9LACO|nr:hypothetical protein [Levilactobacillus bambusae]PWF99894.1 hypothetical protein DCM90_02780 [Levilactobacillus bambusae]
MRDFTALMDQLRDGQLESFEIEEEEFPEFQKAYMAYETRKRVIGQAERGGKVIYHYEHDDH